jgi:hypothetical protein
MNNIIRFTLMLIVFTGLLPVEFFIPGYFVNKESIQVRDIFISHRDNFYQDHFRMEHNQCKKAGEVHIPVLSALFSERGWGWE